MKEIDISYLNNSSVSSLADALRVSMEGLRVRFGDVVCCPHHIVPIVLMFFFLALEGCFRNHIRKGLTLWGQGERKLLW